MGHIIAPDKSRSGYYGPEKAQGFKRSEKFKAFKVALQTNSTKKPILKNQHMGIPESPRGINESNA